MFRCLLIRDDHVELCDRRFTLPKSIADGAIFGYRHRQSSDRQCQHVTGSGVAFFSSVDKTLTHVGIHIILCPHCGSNSNASQSFDPLTLNINGEKWLIINLLNHGLPCTWKFIRHE